MLTLNGYFSSYIYLFIFIIFSNQKIQWGMACRGSDIKPNLLFLCIILLVKIVFNAHAVTLQKVGNYGACDLRTVTKNCQKISSRPCRTCHMAVSFMPLPRAATTTLCSTDLLLAALLHATSTLCSTDLLLAALLHATSCAATTLWSSSRTSAPLPSPFAATLTHWGLQPFSYLASHLITLAQTARPGINHNIGIALTTLSAAWVSAFKLEFAACSMSISI